VLVPIEGVVAPAVSVRPSPVAFGLVQLGREVTRNVVIQGQESFQIMELAGPDDRFGVAPLAKLNTPSRVHLIPVTFRAGAKSGKIEGEILIRTNIGGGRILRVDVTGEVVGDTKGVTTTTGADDTVPAVGKKSSDGWTAKEAGASS
jgi:hypothetical protein